MPDFKTILVPIDFSENSPRLLQEAADVAKKLECELCAVFVVQSFEDYSGFFVPHMPINQFEDEMVQSIFPQGAVESLQVCVCIWRAIGNGDALDAQDFVQPAVEVATVAALLAIFLSGESPAVLPKDAIVVVDQEPRSFTPRRRLAQLLLDPRQRRRARHATVHYSSGPDLHDDEDVCNGEQRRVLGEEITRPHLIGVVLYKGPPCLTTSRCCQARDHVAPHGATGMADAELGCELLGNLVLTPLGMVGGDAFDEVDVVSRDPRAARFGFAAPQGEEALLVPSNNRRRLHNDQRTSPV